MFRGLAIPVEREPIHRTTITVPTTEDAIRRTLEQFALAHPAVRLGSYPDRSWPIRVARPEVRRAIDGRVHRSG
jgi:hypothetical protein